jgi:hypothetical protein
MNSSGEQNSGALHSMPPLLIAESADEFALLQKQLKDEIQPQGVIEQMYVDDFATLTRGILHFRRYKTIMIDSHRREALSGILGRLLCSDDYDDPRDQIYDANDLAISWFDSKKAQATASQIPDGRDCHRSRSLRIMATHSAMACRSPCGST